MKRRIARFLGQTLYADEFAHTILHTDVGKIRAADPAIAKPPAEDSKEKEGKVKRKEMFWSLTQTYRDNLPNLDCNSAPLFQQTPRPSQPPPAAPDPARPAAGGFPTTGSGVREPQPMPADPPGRAPPAPAHPFPRAAAVQTTSPLDLRPRRNTTRRCRGAKPARRG